MNTDESLRIRADEHTFPTVLAYELQDDGVLEPIRLVVERDGQIAMVGAPRGRHDRIYIDAAIAATEDGKLVMEAIVRFRGQFVTLKEPSA